jgi:hypothetical protein
MNYKNSYALFVLIICTSLFQLFSSMNILYEDLMTSITEVLRMKSGQIVYLDYTSHNGPLAGLIFFIFSKFLSIGNAFLLLSILLSTSATLITYSLLSTLKIDNLIKFTTCVFVSIWFLPIVGGWYYDNLSIFFGYLAFYFYIKLKKTSFLFFLIGFIFTLAFLSKPTVGIIISCTVVISIIIFQGINSTFFKQISIIILSGLIFCSASILVIAIFSDIKIFIQSFIIDSLYYSNLVDKKPLNILISLIKPFQINIINSFKNYHMGAITFIINFYFLYYFSLFSIFHKFKFYKKNRLFFSYLIFIILGTVACGSFVGRNFTHIVYFFPVSLGLLYFVYKDNFRYKLVLIFIAFLTLINFIGHYNSTVKFNESSFDLVYSKEFSNLKIKNSNWHHIDIDIIYELSHFLKPLMENKKFAFYDDNLRPLSLMLDIPSWNKSLSQMDELNMGASINNDFWQYEEIKFLNNHKIDFIVTSLESSKWRFRLEYENIQGFNNMEIFKKYININYIKIFDKNGLKVFKLK